MTWLPDLAADLRYALRAMRRAPAYATVAVLALAVGIGATTGVVSIVNAVILRALPYRDAGALAALIEHTPRHNQRTPSYPAFKDYLGAVGGPVAGLAYTHGGPVPYRTIDGLERVVAYWVSPGFFPLMDTPALRGRAFTQAEERAGANAVVVLSYDFWRQRFHSDSSIVGRTINLDSMPTTVVGVMPNGFDYPQGAQLWMPIASVETRSASLQSRGVHVDSRTVVRLRSPRDSAGGAAVLGVVSARLAAEYPAEGTDWTGVDFWPMRNQVIGNISGTLFTLAGAAALVLLLACANVATLVLMRGSVRARELAVRISLGATRGRIARQVGAEVVVLALAGGMGGVLFAAAIVRAVRQLMGGRLPRASELAVDPQMIGIAIAVTLATAAVVAIVPALRTSRHAMAERLHGWNSGSISGRRDSFLRGALVALQVALAVTLLVGAGLLLQSFRRLYAIPDDYDTQRIASAAIFPPSPAYDKPADAAALYARLLDAVKRIPGVENVAVVNHIGGRIPSRVEVPNRAEDNSGPSTAYYLTASSEYQRTMGLRMVRGRWLNDADMRAPDASGFVINEAMAARFFGTANPLGQVITVHRASQARADIGQPISGPVVGVVADIHWYGQENKVEPEVYVPYTREVWPWITLVVRAKSPERVAPDIRKAVFSVDPNIPLSAGNNYTGIETPRKGISFDSRELTLSMIGTFAACALLLAAIGLYGVVAYGVTQRTREIGVRMALGATAADIARLVLGGVGRLVMVGLVAGLIAGYVGTRLIRAMLFHTAPTDPVTLALVPAMLAVVALCATWHPTRRAMKLQPTIAMKVD